MERDLLKNSQPKVKRELGIAFITRVQITIYIQGMTSVLSIPFPQEIVRDLDIIDQFKLTALIKSTITQQKLPPATLTLLLANDLLFAKQLMNNDPDAQAAEEQAFVDMVPYEEVLVQKIPFNNAVYITVANKDLIEGIIKSFEANNFTVPLVLPAYSFSKEVNFAAPLQPQPLLLLITKTASFKQFSFLKIPVIQKISNENKLQESAKPEVASLTSTTSPEAPKKSNRVVVLVGVFIMLIGILIAVYLWTSQSNQSLKEKNAKAASTPATSSPVPTKLPVTTTQTAVQGVRDVKVTLVYPSEESQNAIIIQDSLASEGFTQIEKNQSESTDTTSISFDNNVPRVIKDKIINSVSRVYEKVVIKNSNSFSNPITITLSSE